jgi:Primase X
MTLQNINPTIDREISIKENLDLILSHLSNPLFPRTIMTRALGHQRKVFNADEALTHFKASNYVDCRINAYPSYTEYQGINLTPPSFIMIDLDLKDFKSKEKLDKVLHKTLNKISEVFPDAQSTVLWTGGGYHIYQPILGFVLEEIDRFACFVDPNKRNLTSRFMQFASECFTDKKSDPHHRPSIKSCLIRIPSTINSKYSQEVIIVQKWNGIRPPIQYLLRDFRIWLVAEKINDRRQEEKFRNYSKLRGTGYIQTNPIPWIEKLLQTPIPDHRKYALWRIIMPYLFNIKKISDPEIIGIVQYWLDQCSLLKPLDFSARCLIRQNFGNSRKYRYYPISFNKLNYENNELYYIISKM